MFWLSTFSNDLIVFLFILAARAKRNLYRLFQFAGGQLAQTEKFGKVAALGGGVETRSIRVFRPSLTVTFTSVAQRLSGSTTAPRKNTAESSISVMTTPTR